MTIRLAEYLPIMTEQQYRDDSAVSQTTLKKLADNDMSIFEKKEHKFSKGLSLGSVVDKLLLEEGFDVYKEYNITPSVPDLNGQTAINKLLRYIDDSKIEVSLEDVHSINGITKDLGLWGNIKKDELRISRINSDEFKEGLEYIKLKKNRKPFLLHDDLILAMKMAEILRTNKYTKEIFNKSDDFEYIWQGKIFFEVFGFKAKAMLDIIMVDHINKIIYPKDLKTGEDASFYKNFNRFGYAKQASMYTLALQDLVNRNEELKGYEIAPFEFIYISRSRPTRPKIYDMHPMYIDMGINGWTSTLGITYIGIIKLIENYNWHLQNNILDISREEFNRKGRKRIGKPFNAERVAGEIIERAERRVSGRIPSEEAINAISAELRDAATTWSFGSVAEPPIPVVIPRTEGTLLEDFFQEEDNEEPEEGIGF